MRRRRYLTVSVGLATTIAGLSGVSADTSGGIETETQGDPDPIPFEGTGATVTDEFELEGGVAIAESTHAGQSNFIVDLIPVDDGREELLVNVIGAFDGASGVLAEQGTYLLDVDADGNWTIDIRQPRSTEDEADPLPTELDGTEPAWDGPLLFDGLGEARGTHEGQGNFIVEILPQNGRFPELVFNEIDQFDGETTFDVDGVGYVTVEADGPWTIELE